MKVLRGKKGTSVNISILHEGERKEVDLLDARRDRMRDTDVHVFRPQHSGHVPAAPPRQRNHRHARLRGGRRSRLHLHRLQRQWRAFRNGLTPIVGRLSGCRAKHSARLSGCYKISSRRF